jgi:hypothetical protein
MFEKEMFEKERFRLDDAMRRLAAELAEVEAPAFVESAVRAEFDRARRRRRGRQWAAGIGAIAAAAIAIVVTQSWPLHKPVAPAVVESETERPFMPIPYVLPPAPYERMEVVRMQVPVSALIAAGLPMQTADPGAQAEADVLVGQDGRPRAVRLVSISYFN